MDTSKLVNYGDYQSLWKNMYYPIDLSTITEDNIDQHFYWILNILRDGIETPEVQSMKIGCHFTDGIVLNISIFEYWFNLIFWTIPIKTNQPLESKYFYYWGSGITKKTIKSYVDSMFIRSFRTTIAFKKMNNIIDDTMYKLKYINEFALYLANTINFEDTLDMMKKYPDFNQAIHADLSKVPLEDVKNTGMEYASLLINHIKNSDHCLRDTFIAQEALNPKQFKEVFVNIGSKPNGQGGVFPYIINKSFINGGVNEPESYIIESAVGRTAQILQKMNVGSSGAFARLLEINNIDTYLHPDPEYSCGTKNFEKVIIYDASWLKIYDMRYYRVQPDGIDYILDAKKDTHLIGKELFFRSPMTCASFAHGEGICRKCYGDLYYIMENVNPGKIAAELLSSKYTQILLSAKHLLESMVVKMEWTEGFDQLFIVNMNTIGLIEDQDYTGYTLIIDPDSIPDNDDEDDDSTAYSECIPYFYVIDPDGKETCYHTADEDNIYITEDLNTVLKSKKAKYADGRISIQMNHLKELPMIFQMHIKNKELSRTLDRSKNIINKAAVTGSYNRHSILADFIKTNMDGNVRLNAVHMEVILANQIRNADDILEKPDWTVPDVDYKILTLGSSLTNNPSITVTLEYQKIAATLVSPLSTRKTKPSSMDVFFMLKPQTYIDDTHGMVSDDYKMRDELEDDYIKPALIFHDDEHKK